MHKVLDGDADDRDKQDLTLHLKACGTCREHFEELQKTEAIVQSASGIRAPEHLKDTIIDRLPGEHRTSKARRWLQRHAVLTAAALFLIFMAGYLFSLWQGPGQVSVVGKGHVKQGNHVVIVPKDEVIHGDLIVRNSNVKIKGKVKGNVTVIHGKQYLASAGQVTGHIREVNQVVGWIWYQIKHLFTGWTPPYEIRKLDL
ncbi:MAG TPA: anti-sigma factor [Bacillales bacterium]|nr:anti-sigma factor [Bacillales bacterium]